MRPWRLTRRARVEMEAALSKLRRDALSATGCHTRGVYVAMRQFGRPIEFYWYASEPTGDAWRMIPLRDWRILRARVALALRAALRADEDARCEEAYMRVFLTGRLGYYGETIASNDGAWRAVVALREWPIEKRDEAGRVPRALWEVTR